MPELNMYGCSHELWMMRNLDIELRARFCLSVEVSGLKYIIFLVENKKLMMQIVLCMDTTR